MKTQSQSETMEMYLVSTLNNLLITVNSFYVFINTFHSAGKLSQHML